MSTALRRRRMRRRAGTGRPGTSGMTAASPPAPAGARDRGQVRVAGSVEQTRGPAEDSRRVARGGERVPGVLLAIAEGPVAVLPGLAPVDRGQAEEKAAGWQEPREGG